ncbi:hypothetical protein J3R83DRAFT_13674 [Lanmaoa asiatica]|nr:hypothetical protein J3R83DRAFT_13674 [Lanmaoa asiatica]
MRIARLWSQILTGVRGTTGTEDATQGSKGGRGGVDADVDGEPSDALGACVPELVCPPPPLLIGAFQLTHALTASNTHRPTVFTALVKLFSEPQYLASKEGESSGGTGLTEIDYEEQTAGYQAAYSRLAASESGPVDPVGYVGDVRAFLGRALGGRTGGRSGVGKGDVDGVFGGL